MTIRNMTQKWLAAVFRNGKIKFVFLSDKPSFWCTIVHSTYIFDLLDKHNLKII